MISTSRRRHSPNGLKSVGRGLNGRFRVPAATQSRAAKVGALSSPGESLIAGFRPMLAARFVIIAFSSIPPLRSAVHLGRIAAMTVIEAECTSSHPCRS